MGILNENIMFQNVFVKNPHWKSVSLPDIKTNFFWLHTTFLCFKLVSSIMAFPQKYIYYLIVLLNKKCVQLKDTLVNKVQISNKKIIGLIQIEKFVILRIHQWGTFGVNGKSEVWWEKLESLKILK